jgi:uncharacterized repeat protein (TIGR03803 family)
LYGGAYGEGGSNYGDGTVYRLTPSPKGYDEDVIHSFRPKTDGENPEGGITSDETGALYGTTCCFGKGGYGTVFKLAPSATGQYVESVQFYFSGSKTGENPEGGVISVRGALYGATTGGGAGCGCGTVFKLTH